MQRIKNRKLYDTEQADRIARYAPNTDTSDFHYLVETLYETADGEYFLHGEGGAATDYAKQCNGVRTGSEELELLTEERALDWCEERAIDAAVVLDEFDHLIDT